MMERNRDINRQKDQVNRKRERLLDKTDDEKQCEICIPLINYFKIMQISLQVQLTGGRGGRKILISAHAAQLIAVLTRTATSQSRQVIFYQDPD